MSSLNPLDLELVTARNLIMLRSLFAAIALGAFLSVGSWASKPPEERSYAQVVQERRPLANSRIEKNYGSKDATGNCRMPGYRINAKMGGEPVEARQLSIDLNTCVETIQVGTPVDENTTPSDGTSDSSSAQSIAGTEQPAELSALAVTHSIQMQVRWEDVLNIDVNKTHSLLTFTYDGGCITNSSGSGYWWWRTGTFWSRTAYSAYINRIPEGWCVPTPDNTKRSRYVQNYVDGTFKNGIFCAGFDTYVYYDNVTTYGVYNGNVSGWFDSTWVNEPIGCPPLHWVANFVP